MSKLFMVVVVAVAASVANAQETAFKTEYWSAVGVATGSALADAWTSQQGYQRAAGCHEVGNAWLYGRRPGTAREYGMMLGEVGLSAVASWRIHRAHGWVRRLWSVPLVFQIEEHARGAIINTGVCR